MILQLALLVPKLYWKPSSLDPCPKINNISLYFSPWYITKFYYNDPDDSHQGGNYFVFKKK